jgi:CheY-like chemotaxis protein
MDSDNSSPKIKLLLAEDDMLIRDLLTRKLERNGFEVFVAKDGTHVLDLARRQQPDLIALDILMPEMNGYEVLDLLAADAELHKIPVVVISNLGQDYEIQKCKDKGALDFIIKANCTPTEMVQKLRDIYQRSIATS